MQESWDEERARGLVEAFAGGCGQVLLFLRSLRSVRVRTWAADATGPAHMHQVRSACLACWQALAGGQTGSLSATARCWRAWG